MMTAAATALVASRLPVRAQSPVKLRAGGGVVESFSQGAYAAEMGFFTQAGLDVDLETLVNGSATTAAILGGALDVGITNGGSMANAYVRGLPIYCIAASGVATSASPTTLLVTLKDSPIRTARDLNGKTIAVTSLHDLMQGAAMKWIDDNGGDARTVNFAEIHNGDLLLSLTSKRIDASMLLEPMLTDDRDQIRVLGNPYDAVAKTIMISGWITTKAYYDANRSTVQRFVGVMRQTAEWANKNPRASAEILARLTKIPLETVLKMNHNQFATTLDPALIQPTIDVNARFGFLPRAFSASEMFPPKA